LKASEELQQIRTELADEQKCLATTAPAPCQSYTIRPDGSIVVDTVDEALAMQKRILATNKAPAPMTEPAKSEPPAAEPRETNGTRESVTSARWQKFLGLVSGKPAQLDLLNLLKTKNGKFVTLDEARNATKSETNSAVGGVMSGVTKNAKKADLDPMQIVDTTTRGRLRAGRTLLDQSLTPGTGATR